MGDVYWRALLGHLTWDFVAEGGVGVHRLTVSKGVLDANGLSSPPSPWREVPRLGEHQPSLLQAPRYMGVRPGQPSPMPSGGFP